MKTVLRTLALGLFVCGSCFMAGCGDEAATDTTDDSSDTSADTTDDEATETSAVTPKATTTETGETADSGELQLVSLKVPNMTWGGCAASVRGALEDVAGVTEINTNVGERTVEFNAPADLDVDAKLAELSETNQHINGWSKN